MVTTTLLYHLTALAVLNKSKGQPNIISTAAVVPEIRNTLADERQDGHSPPAQFLVPNLTVSEVLANFSSTFSLVPSKEAQIDIYPSKPLVPDLNPILPGASIISITTLPQIQMAISSTEEQVYRSSELIPPLAIHDNQSGPLNMIQNVTNLNNTLLQFDATSSINFSSNASQLNSNPQPSQSPGGIQKLLNMLGVKDSPIVAPLQTTISFNISTNTITGEVSTVNHEVGALYLLRSKSVTEALANSPTINATVSPVVDLTKISSHGTRTGGVYVPLAASAGCLAMGGGALMLWQKYRERQLRVRLRRRTSGELPRYVPV